MQHCPSERQVAKSNWLPAFLAQHLVIQVTFPIWKKSGARYMHTAMVKYGHIMWNSGVQSLLLQCVLSSKTGIQLSIRGKNLVGREGQKEEASNFFVSYQASGLYDCCRSLPTDIICSILALAFRVNDFKQNISVESWHFTSRFFKGQMPSPLSNEENPKEL